MGRIGPRRRARTKRFKRRTQPGAPPGTLVADPSAPKPVMTVIAYGAGGCTERTIHSLEQARALLAEHSVTWINVEGLGDAAAIRQFEQAFALHALALEDVINTHQRPKCEPYENGLFFVAREFALRERLTTDQLSIFLGKNFVVTFQEHPGDCLDPVRARIREPSSRFRAHGADYLVYAVLDAVVDSYFPLIEQLGERLEHAEDRILKEPCQKDLNTLHDVKHDLMTVRRAAWPLREALNNLIRDSHPLITPETRTYLRDCADHTVQIIDLVETDRELCSDLRDIYLSTVSNRLNQVMKLLTIISTIFIPLTFLAGVYGMNFHTDAGPLSMPELLWKHGYLAFWVVCLLIAIALLTLFWRLGWLYPLDPDTPPTAPRTQPSDSSSPSRSA